MAEELGEGLGEHRAEAFDAGDPGLALQGGLVEVDEHLPAGAQRGQLSGGQGLEAVEGGVEVRWRVGGASRGASEQRAVVEPPGWLPSGGYLTVCWACP
ncbi:hypothetical protein, partial [Nocardioides ferulae]|uniref:hypothetical protein n=1 Tax=Nocardioides ferulae TaxID=2340821 RepID=UPI001980778F